MRCSNHSCLWKLLLICQWCMKQQQFVWSKFDVFRRAATCKAQISTTVENTASLIYVKYDITCKQIDECCNVRLFSVGKNKPQVQPSIACWSSVIVLLGYLLSAPSTFFGFSSLLYSFHTTKRDEIQLYKSYRIRHVAMLFVFFSIHIIAFFLLLQLIHGPYVACNIDVNLS